MCLQCLTDPLYYGKVFPGWSLMRARRQYFDEMKVKEWGLLQCNDPDYYFMTTPKLFDDSEEGELKEDYLTYDFANELSNTPTMGMHLMNSFQTTPEVEAHCEKRGYTSFEQKLYVHLAMHIRDCKVESDLDYDPDWKPLDNDQPSDYTFDPKE